MLPSYMLSQVYVQKSLKNTTDGFEFKLKNIIDTGTLGGVVSLAVDGASLPLASMTVRVGAIQRKAEEITYRNSLLVMMGAEVTVSVKGQPLAPGRHEFKLAVSILEAGRTEFTLADDVAE